MLARLAVLRTPKISRFKNSVFFRSGAETDPKGPRPVATRVPLNNPGRNCFLFHSEAGSCQKTSPNYGPVLWFFFIFAENFSEIFD
jgi:hypothetical protein